MRHRISVARLLAVVAACGLALASLRSAGPAWEGILLTAVLVVLALALVSAACRSGRGRAFWAGFSIAGWLYLSACYVPGLEPKLLSTALLDLSYAYVTPPAAPPDITEPDMEHIRALPVGLRQEDLDAEAVQRRWYEDRGLGYDYFGWGDGPRMHSTQTYRAIGHCWLGLVIALAAGGLAARLCEQSGGRG
jgi:hypothetical protein